MPNEQGQQVILKQYSYRRFTEDTKTYAALKWHIKQYRGKRFSCGFDEQAPNISRLTLRVFQLKTYPGICKHCLKLVEKIERLHNAD